MRRFEQVATETGATEDYEDLYEDQQVVVVRKQA